jgi:hypothetical protein
VLKRFLLFAYCLLPLFAQAAKTVTGNVTDIAGTMPSNIAVFAEVKNCGTNIVRGGGLYVPQTPVPLDAQGNFSVMLQDQTTLACGVVPSAAYYRFSIVRLDPITSRQLAVIAYNDYDITGSGTVALKDLPPRNPSLPPVPIAVLENPANSQPIVQPPGTALIVIGESSTAADFSMLLETPVVSDSGKFQHKLSYAGKFVAISCSTDAGTASVNFEVRTEAATNTSGTAVLASPLVCAPATAATSTFAAATFAVNAPLALIIVSNSGAGIVRVHVHVQPTQ